MSEFDTEKCKILVVGDLQDDLRLLRAVLEQEGYEVRLVRDGRSALESAARFQPGAILLDAAMPQANGFEVCRQLKADPRTRDIPAIFLTALDDAIDKIRGFQAGGADYVTKPFQTEEVLVRIGHQLRMRQLQRQLEEQNESLQQEVRERKRAEAAARAASEAKSTFLANVSHELRSPLHTILGFTEFLLDSSDFPQNYREEMGIIAHSSRHLLNLINDVLDISKIEAGHVSFDPCSFDLHALLLELKAMFLLQADRKGLELAVTWDDSVPRYVETDEVKLRQTIVNLLSNATKFTSKGSVALTVSGRETAGDTYHLSFSVADTGMGIAPEEMGKIFRPFEQSFSGRSSGQGTGLGLAIAREFVQLMDGELQSESKLGRGSRFFFTIPVAIPATLPEFLLPDSLAALQCPVSLAAGQPEYRLLVVDDVRVNRLLLVRLLKKIGFAVREATNGEEAIALWNSWHPHLIFMDVRMAGTNGYEATRRIRDLESQARAPIPAEQTPAEQTPATAIPPTKIIALTASAMEESRREIIAAGCNDFLFKPVRLETLYAKISEHIGARYDYDMEEGAIAEDEEP